MMKRQKNAVSVSRLASLVCVAVAAMGGATGCGEVESDEESGTSEQIETSEENLANGTWQFNGFVAKQWCAFAASDKYIPNCMSPRRLGAACTSAERFRHAPNVNDPNMLLKCL